MLIIRNEVGMVDCNCYIVACEKTGEGIIIDAGGDAGRIVADVRKHNVKVKQILCTHGHFDHLGGLADLVKEINVPISIHEADRELYENMPQQGMLFGLELEPNPVCNHFLQDGENIAFGEHMITVLHTPGHTKGGVCFLIGTDLFSGDTLFEESIGRTDLPGGSMNELINSIKTKLMVLPDETVVYPGHGDKTSIGFEKQNNPYL